MLDRSSRLKKRDIARVYKKSQRLNADFMAVRFMSNMAKSSRFCIVIPKAVVKLSTARSRLKRKISEAIEANRSQLKRNYDIILSIRKNPAEAEIGPAIKKIMETTL